MFIGTWSDIYVHIPVHVHTHLDDPRNSHLTLGQRCTVGALFTLTHHTRHPRHAPLRHPDSPSPTHKYAYVYTIGSDTVTQAETAVAVPAQICTPTNKDIHTSETHTIRRGQETHTGATITGTGTPPQADGPAETAQTHTHRFTPILPHGHRCGYTPRHPHTLHMC